MVDPVELGEVWTPFFDDPRTAGVFTDFDGTLARIVDDPSAASLVPGVREVLGDLASRFGRVGVLTGRPVSFLEPQLPPSVLVVGLYGLEVIEHGTRLDHQSAGTWREVIDDVAKAASDCGPPGMRVESKGVSLTLHYREVPEIAEAVREFAERQACRSGLECRPARMSIELHPPIRADKGTALAEHAEGLEAVCFIGDDVGDLPAFAALDAMAVRGVHTVRVAVASPECPAELLARADVVVDGIDAAVELLSALAGHRQMPRAG